MSCCEGGCSGLAVPCTAAPSSQLVSQGHEAGHSGAEAACPGLCDGVIGPAGSHDIELRNETCSLHIYAGANCDILSAGRTWSAVQHAVRCLQTRLSYTFHGV